MSENKLDQDELNRETYMDVAIIALSYILMFVYITFSLGRITTWRRFLVSYKIHILELHAFYF